MTAHTLAKNYQESCLIVSEDELSKTYTMPKSYVSYRKPRAIAETKRQQTRDMMKEINSRASTE